MSAESEATRLLKRMSDGEGAAEERLAELVYDELRGLSEGLFRNQRKDHTLQPTALVNEAWLRLIKPPAGGWDGHGHFLAVAARAMRSILVDHVRRKRADRRGAGAERVLLDESQLGFEERAFDLVALDDALSELAAVDAIAAKVVELRFFGGMTCPQVAEALSVSLTSVERSWRTSRAWLHSRIAGSDA